MFCNYLDRATQSPGEGDILFPQIVQCEDGFSGIRHELLECSVARRCPRLLHSRLGLLVALIPIPLLFVFFLLTSALYSTVQIEY